MNSSEKQGKLVIIGGAEDKEGDCIILREFVRCAGGSKAKIVVLTAASGDPQEVGENYVRVFKRIGVEDVQVFHTRHRDDVDSEDRAIVVSGDEFKVVGSGSVTILKESESSYNNLPDLRKDENMAIFDIQLHILPHGYRFNLKTFRPLLPETQAEGKKLEDRE